MKAPAKRIVNAHLRCGLSPTRHRPVALSASRAIVLSIMIHDLITAFLVAFAAVTASELLSRIWGYF
jgi:hypothetical protein